VNPLVRHVQCSQQAFFAMENFSRCLGGFVGASLLAMVVNDYARTRMPRGALGFFASELAPTGDALFLFRRQLWQRA
jgi:hypothetical protein